MRGFYYNNTLMSMAKVKQEAKRQTLVWVANGREGYGVATTVIDQSNCLRKRGWAVIAICFVDGEFVSALKSAGIDVQCLGLDHAPKMLTGGFIQRIKIYRAMQRANKEGRTEALRLLNGVNVSVVATCTPIYLNVVSYLAKAKQGMALWRMASSVQRKPFPFDYRRWVLQWQCWRGKVLAMANSEYTAASLRGGPAQVCANLHGCDSPRFLHGLKPHNRADLGLSDNAKVFAIIGRLDETGDKGQSRFIEALESLGDKLISEHNIHLLLLGGPTDTDFAIRLRNQCNSAALHGRVHMLGFVNDSENYYAAIDVAVNVRLTAEPFGLSVIEAMTTGTPVLAHGLGGPAETIIDGTTGWLTASANVHNLAAGIKRVLRDWNQLNDMSVSAKQHAARHFTLEQEINRWLTIVEPALNSQQQAQN